MAVMGKYRLLLQDFLKSEHYIKREDLRPIKISGISEDFENEINHSYLSKVIGSLLDIKGLILAYDVDEKKKFFKFWNKKGQAIGLTIIPEKEEIGISEDGIERIWVCHRSNLGDVKLSPIGLGIQEEPLSVLRRFDKDKAKITAYDRKHSLSIRIEDTKDEFFILPYEDMLIDNLMTLGNSLRTITLEEAYDLTKDITGLRLNHLNVEIKKSKKTEADEEISSGILINKGEIPVLYITLPAPNDEKIIYTITDTENGHVNVTMTTICGNKNTTIKKPIKTNLSIMELHDFLMEIIKMGKIKTRD